MDQPRRQFLAETEDLIEQVFVALDELREERNRQRQRELIDEIFRRVHRIKGSGATFGLEGLSAIAHEFENLLSALRTEALVVTHPVLDVCESAATALSESLTMATSGVIEPSRRELFESVRELVRVPDSDTKSDGRVAAVIVQLPQELSQALTDEEKRRIARRHAEGNCICLVSASFNLESFDEQFYSLKEKLAERGEVISTSPAVDPNQAEKINFRILFSSTTRFDEVQSSLVGFPDLSLTELRMGSLDGTEQASETKRPQHTPGSRSNFIRTDLDDLDRLISSTHELYRLTTRSLDIAHSAVSRAEGQTFDQLAREIRRSFHSVEDALINLRMVSLGPTLQRAVRAGRAAARLSNKQVDFEVVGSELRLDKLLADTVADPLVHLVRNAVDHGIESSSEARVAAGKPARGTVTIEAVSEGGRTRLRVHDDGRGIDLAAVSRAASKLGIIDQESNLDMQRSVRLIFRPGFSTLSEASTVSGRGVGLDIVETAVEQVGGEVRVSSESGRSSIFEIRLPVTFSLLTSTVVTAGANRYCLDTREVINTAAVSSGEIVSTPTGEAFQSANSLMPLIRLRELLGVTNSPTKAEPSVITCELPLRLAGETGELVETRNGKRLIGLVVDGLNGTEEVLVRKLGRHAGRWYGVAGATELRDGTIALVLDLPRLLANSR